MAVQMMIARMASKMASGVMHQSADIVHACIVGCARRVV